MRLQKALCDASPVSTGCFFNALRRWKQNEERKQIFFPENPCESRKTSLYTYWWKLFPWPFCDESNKNLFEYKRKMLLWRISLIALNRFIKLCYENKEIPDSQKNRTIYFLFFFLSPFSINQKGTSCSTKIKNACQRVFARVEEWPFIRILLSLGSRH